MTHKIFQFLSIKKRYRTADSGDSGSGSTSSKLLGSSVDPFSLTDLQKVLSKDDDDIIDESDDDQENPELMAEKVLEDADDEVEKQRSQSNNIKERLLE